MTRLTEGESATYVALVGLPWGDGRLEIGDRVPVEEGRNYHQMLMLGQIGHLKASDTVTVPEGAIAVYLHPDARAIFVNEDGEHTEVVYLGSQAPDEAARVALELSPGALAALVKFPDDPEPSLVTQDSLLWGDAAHLLVLKVEETEAARETLGTQLEAATTTVEASTGLQAQVDWLTLLLSAVRIQGEAISEDAPGFKELAAVGVYTRVGLAMLAVDPANLLKVKGIGQATADKILTWLNPPAEIPNAAG